MLLLCFGCAAPIPTPPPRLMELKSFAQPLLIKENPNTVSVVNWQGFEWDDDGPGVAGYNLYYGFLWPHEYDNVIASKDIQCVLSNMVPGTTYHLSVTAVDTNGVESDFSPDFVFVMPMIMEFGFSFDRAVTNISVESSPDFQAWKPSNARQITNGIWRVKIDTNVPTQFYRSAATTIPQ
ncbi:MAG TPA: fibronectin type III domain-containing protein [Terriglobales bacterium]|nr:fibronectin type III domain-containing protein [Terriglobales bacterium]